MSFFYECYVNALFTRFAYFVFHRNARVLHVALSLCKTAVLFTSFIAVGFYKHSNGQPLITFVAAVVPATTKRMKRPSHYPRLVYSTSLIICGQWVIDCIACRKIGNPETFQPAGLLCFVGFCWVAFFGGPIHPTSAHLGTFLRAACSEQHSLTRIGEPCFSQQFDWSSHRLAAGAAANNRLMY